MNVTDFERRYQADPDPWSYLHSPYEREKYHATLAACGPEQFRCALELGASIGVFSALLAPRCRQLITVDFAPTAVATATTRLAAHPHVQVLAATLPTGLPAGRYDLVVASEILYYLTEPDLDATLAALRSSMSAGARLVAAHWLPAGPERPLDAQQVHTRLAEQPWLMHDRSAGTDDYLLDVLTRR